VQFNERPPVPCGDPTQGPAKGRLAAFWRSREWLYKPESGPPAGAWPPNMYEPKISLGRLAPIWGYRPSPRPVW